LNYFGDAPQMLLVGVVSSQAAVVNRKFLVEKKQVQTMFLVEKNNVLGFLCFVLGSWFLVHC